MKNWVDNAPSCDILYNTGLMNYWRREVVMILETIVKAIEESSESRYAVSFGTGIDQSVLHRIVNGGSCSIQTADILCEYLELELVPKKGKERQVRR